MNSNNIIYGEYDPTLEPDSRGVGPLLFEKMKKYSKNIAQIDTSTGEKQTYEDMLLKSITVAQNMASRGITSNEVISLCVPNIPDSFLPYLAAIFNQIKVACLDPSISSDECTHLLKSVKPTYVFCGVESVHLIETALKTASLKSKLVVFGETDKHIPFSEFLTSTGSEESFLPKPVEDMNAPPVIFFSSGTTGLPKGICSTHYGLICTQLLFMRGYDLSVMLYYTSLYWISGSAFLIMSILQGTTRLLLQKFNPETVLQIIEQYKVTYVFMSPYLVTQLIKYNENSRNDTSTVKSIAVGGGKIIEEHLFALSKILPHVTVCHLYGMTENHGICTYVDPYEDKEMIKRKPTSAGKPAPGYTFKIVDIDTNEIVGPYKKGEICLKSRCLTTGYYNKPKETAEAFDEDGFFKSGDIGYYDEDHWFYIVDRIKEAMKYQSWQVIPAELEGVLLSHPAVKEAAVFGKPHVVDGEHPMAAVVLYPRSKITEEELLSYVNERVPERKKLRGGLVIVEQLLYTPTGKIQRRKLRDLLVR